MKIFAGGIATETNTFSPIPTAYENFLIQRGEDSRRGIVNHPSLDLSQSWGRLAAQRGYSFHFAMMAWASPGGPTTHSAYSRLRSELLADLLAAGPVNVVLLNLHGAMIADGCDDCERDIIESVRAIVGSQAIIAVLLDLHCNITERTIAAADAVVIYKEYPHVDINQRAEEIFEIATAAAEGRIKPKMALFDCKMVGFYPTTRSPMREFVDDMIACETEPGVLSLSLAHGFPPADVAAQGARMLAIADGHASRAADLARSFGLRANALRRQIGIDSFALPLSDALTAACAADKWPVVVADVSDNTGGGAPGDATFALHWLIEHGTESAALAIIHDPEAVKLARQGGVGARMSIRLGGKSSPYSGLPVDLDVTVIATLSNYLHRFPQVSGEPMLYPVGDIVALRSGGLTIVVGSIRCQCFSPTIFSDLGIEPESQRVLVVKSAHHFYSAFAPIASHVLYACGPGIVSPDPRLMPYSKFDPSGHYPWNDDPLHRDGSMPSGNNNSADQRS